MLGLVPEPDEERHAHRECQRKRGDHQEADAEDTRDRAARDGPERDDGPQCDDHRAEHPAPIGVPHPREIEQRDDADGDQQASRRKREEAVRTADPDGGRRSATAELPPDERGAGERGGEPDVARIGPEVGRAEDEDRGEREHRDPDRAPGMILLALQESGGDRVGLALVRDDEPRCDVEQNPGPAREGERDECDPIDGGAQVEVRAETARDAAEPATVARANEAPGFTECLCRFHAYRVARSASHGHPETPGPATEESARTTRPVAAPEGQALAPEGRSAGDRARARPASTPTISRPRTLLKSAGVRQ